MTTQISKLKQKQYNIRREQFIINKLKQLRQLFLGQQNQINNPCRNKYINVNLSKDRPPHQQQYQKEVQSLVKVQAVISQDKQYRKQVDDVQGRLLFIKDSTILRYIQEYIAEYFPQHNLINKIVTQSIKQKCLNFYGIYIDINNYIQKIHQITNNHNSLATIHGVANKLATHITSSEITIGQYGKKQMEQMEQFQQGVYDARYKYFQHCIFVCFVISYLAIYQLQLKQNPNRIQNILIEALQMCLELNEDRLNQLSLQTLITIYNTIPSLLQKPSHRNKLNQLLQQLLSSITNSKFTRQNQTNRVKLDFQLEFPIRYQSEEDIIDESRLQLAYLVIRQVDICILEQWLNYGLFHKILQTERIDLIQACMNRIPKIQNRQLQLLVGQAYSQFIKKNDSVL